MLSPLMFVFYINELIKESEANQCKGIYVDEKHPNVSMFVFYINELIKESEANQCKGIYVDEKHPNVSMLLHADDVLLADNVGHLQESLDNLASFCIKWGLTVNMDKTNFMAFRNGGVVKKNEKVYFNGEKVKSTPHYKYLGVVMSARLSWSPAQKTLAEQAEKSVNCIRTLNEM